ncbi:TNF receptor-associated factor 5-like isoform X4 [Montipora foliosa]|uniref:TNF receptor-associated factor 5-like isoform X3 n=1 Tax=Montipora foliosa TaxID=591990 RepID=UPI0035F19F98
MDLFEDCAGYDFDFVDELQEDQVCPICKGAMRDPVQIVECGHQCCEYCLMMSQRDGGGLHCPLDGKRLPDNNAFIEDKAFKRKICSLRVKCKQHCRGCKWIGEIRNYLDHYEICQFEDQVCKDCSMSIERQFMEDHKNNGCDERTVRCKYCPNVFPHCDLQEHVEKECHSFPVKCPQECGRERIPRKEVESHVANECPRTVVSCPYSVIGCTFENMRSALDLHIQDSTEKHQRQALSLASKNAELENEVRELKKNFELSNEAQNKLASENLELRNGYSDLTQKYDLAFKSIMTRLSAVEESQKHELESKCKETEDMRCKLESHLHDVKEQLSNVALKLTKSEFKIEELERNNPMIIRNFARRLLAVDERDEYTRKRKAAETFQREGSPSIWSLKNIRKPKRAETFPREGSPKIWSLQNIRKPKRAETFQREGSPSIWSLENIRKPKRAEVPVCQKKKRRVNEPQAISMITREGSVVPNETAPQKCPYGGCFRAGCPEKDSSRSWLGFDSNRVPVCQKKKRRVNEPQAISMITREGSVVPNETAPQKCPYGGCFRAGCPEKDSSRSWLGFDSNCGCFTRFNSVPTEGSFVWRRFGQ